MDPELKKALDDLRASVGRSADAAAKVDAIEKRAAQADADVKALRGEVEAVKAALTEREQKLRELQEQSRMRAMQADPAKERERALGIFGSMMREMLSRKLGAEIPARFRPEADALRQYREQRATLEAGAVTGSYLVPTLISGQEVIDTVEEVSDLLSRVRFIPDLPGNVDLPTLVTRPSLKPARATVDTTMTASDPAFGVIQIRPDEAYVYFPMDNRLLQMSAVALGSYSLGLLRDAVVAGLCNWIVCANGSSTYNSTTGILNEATYILSMKSGGTSFTKVSNDELNRALAKLLKRGRARASYLMSLYVYGLLEELNRLGKTPVVTFGQDGEPRCKQRPLVIDEDMPDEADDAAATAFMGVGDLSTYIVGMMGGIAVATSEHYKFGENQTAFRAVVNVDLKRVSAWTYLTLKTAAA